MAPALSSQTQKNIKAMIDGWENDSRAAFGDKLTEEISYAQKALDMSPPELRQLLGPVSKGGTGLGSHKAVIAAFAEFGRKISPDAKVVKGSPQAPPPKSAEERLAATYRQQD